MAWPERVDQPDAGPARLADAREVRGHQHLRAGLEVGPSATARAAATSPTVRMTPSAIASANGFGLRDSSDSSEWVIASTPVAAVAAGGRPTVSAGSRIVAAGSSDRMADVALAAGRLVGDDAEAVGLGAGPGRRRDGDDRPARARGPAPS